MRGIASGRVPMDALVCAVEGATWVALSEHDELLGELERHRARTSNGEELSDADDEQEETHVFSSVRPPPPAGPAPDDPTSSPLPTIPRNPKTAVLAPAPPRPSFPRLPNPPPRSNPPPPSSASPVPLPVLAPPPLPQGFAPSSTSSAAEIPPLPSLPLAMPDAPEPDGLRATSTAGEGTSKAKSPAAAHAAAPRPFVGRPGTPRLAMPRVGANISSSPTGEGEPNRTSAQICHTEPNDTSPRLTDNEAIGKARIPFTSPRMGNAEQTGPGAGLGSATDTHDVPARITTSSATPTPLPPLQSDEATPLPPLQSGEATPLPPLQSDEATSASTLLSATTSSSAPPPAFEDRTDPGSSLLVDPGPLGALDVQIELPPPDSGSLEAQPPQSIPEPPPTVPARPVLHRNARQKPPKPGALTAAQSETNTPAPPTVPTVMLRSEPAQMSELTSPAIRALRPRGTVQVSVGTLLIGALSLILLVLLAVLLVR